jgi:hypothetical protein
VQNAISALSKQRTTGKKKYISRRHLRDNHHPGGAGRGAENDIGINLYRFGIDNPFLQTYTAGGGVIRAETRCDARLFQAADGGRGDPAKDGSLAVTTSPDFPLRGSVNDNGEYAGFGIDAAKEPSDENRSSAAVVGGGAGDFQQVRRPAGI